MTIIERKEGTANGIRQPLYEVSTISGTDHLMRNGEDMGPCGGFVIRLVGQVEMFERELEALKASIPEIQKEAVLDAIIYIENFTQSWVAVRDDVLDKEFVYLGEKELTKYAQTLAPNNSEADNKESEL